MPVDQRPRIIQIATTPAVTVRNVVVRLNCPVIEVTASPECSYGCNDFRKPVERHAPGDEPDRRT